MLNPVFVSARGAECTPRCRFDRITYATDARGKARLVVRYRPCVWFANVTRPWGTWKARG